MAVTPAPVPDPAAEPLGPMSFAVAPRTVALLGLTGVAVAGLAALADPAGRVLLAILAVIVLAEAGRAALIRPVLTVGAEGITINRRGGHELLPWHQLQRVNAASGRRFLATTRTLELDTDDRLFVLPGYRLGRSPEAALAEINARWPPDD